jgi:hypothetical protein
MAFSVQCCRVGQERATLVDDALDYVFLLEDLSECHGGFSIPSGIVSIPLIPTGFERIVAVQEVCVVV